MRRLAVLAVLAVALAGCGGQVAHVRMSNGGNTDPTLANNPGSYDALITNPWEVAAQDEWQAAGRKTGAYFETSFCKPYGGTLVDSGPFAGEPTETGFPCSQAKESWFLHTCSAKTSSCRYTNAWDLKAMDVGNAEYQAAWLAEFRRNVERLGWDGTHWDDVLLRRPCACVEYTSDAAWQAAMKEFVQVESAAVVADGMKRNLIVGNAAGWVNDTLDFGCSLSSFISLKEEHFGGESLGFPIQREKIECVQEAPNGTYFYGEAAEGNSQQIAYTQGLCLVFGEGKCAVGVHDHDSSAVWPAAYEQSMSLGDPTGQEFQTSTGLWRRNFEGGYVVVNPSAKTGTITLF